MTKQKNSVTLLGTYGGDKRHCFDNKTELLTTQGWLPISSVTKDTKLYTCDNQLKMAIEQPTDLVAWEYVGDLIGFENDKVDIAVTPEHRMLVRLKGRGNELFIKEAQELIGRKGWYSIPLAANYNGDKLKVTNTNLQLLGFFIGDGTIYGKGKQAIFHLKKQRKIDYLKSIAQVTEISDNRYAVNLSDTQLELFKACYRDGHKAIPADIELTPVIAANIWHGLFEADGTQRNGSYSTTSPQLADQVQALLQMLGKTARITKRIDPRGDRKPCYFIYTRQGSTFTTIDPKRNHAKSIPYSGMVYCVTVPSGALICRRNKKPFVSLNCLSAWQSTELALERGLIDLDVARRIEVLYEETVITKKRPPKDLLTFLAKHEHETPFEKSTLDFQLRGDIASHIHVIKHRIAVSVNSESARYKELKDKWYVPADWEDKPILTYSPPTIATELLMRAGCKTWAEALDRYCWVGHQLYHQAVTELTDRLGRKRAKESARYFLPYAKQLDFDTMFNFRSFMHFVGLRGSNAAQDEIREIAFEMMRQIAELPGRPFEWSLEAYGYNEEFLTGIGAKLDKEHEWK